MTGDLTLGTDKVKLYSGGQIDIYNSTTNAANQLLKIKSDIGGSASVNASIFADGSATFGGGVDALGFWASRDTKDGYINVTQQTGGQAAFNVIDGTGAATAIINGNGSASFAGELWAGTRFRLNTNGTRSNAQSVVDIYDQDGQGVNASTIRLNAGGSASFAGGDVNIDSSGRVSIGAAISGNSRLFLYGNDAKVMYQGSSTETGNGNGFTTGNNGDLNAFVWNYENGYLQFATNNTCLLYTSPSPRD